MRAIRISQGRALTLATVALLILAAWPTRSRADDDIVAGASRARGGAGLRVGTWQVQGLNDPASGSASETASFEGWFQKGLDLHLALESTLGFWQRTESSTQSSGLGSTDRELYTYLVPALTALKMYPVTRPSSPLEPYLAAGLGPVLKIQREEVTSTDPLVLPSDATTIVTGLGIQAGAGIDWSPAGPFGLTLGGHYQWATFGENASGTRMYRGPGLNVGVIYRFRYE